VVGQARAPEVNARTVGARFHRFIPEVPGDDAQRELGAASALKAHQIRGADWDHPGVAAATSRAGQAIELFSGVRGQAALL
jgi:hypothetical protein